MFNYKTLATNHKIFQKQIMHNIIRLHITC